MQSKITIPVFIGLFMFMVGFSVSQLAVGNEVRETSVKVSAMQKQREEDLHLVSTEFASEREQNAKSFEAEKNRTDARIFELAALVRSTIDAEKERQKTLQDFIQTLRVQSDLLRQKNGS